MNNEILFARIKKLVATERRIGIEILECLFEIEKRKAYAALKYDGLFSYCVKELDFTESQAFQRIQAMRALKEIPEIKPMIASGSLSVCAVSKVQIHLRQEKQAGKQVDRAQKFDLFQAMENLTSREVKAKLLEIRGEKRLEKLVLELDEEAQALWSKVKAMSAHRSHGDSLAAFKLLMKTWLQKNDPTCEPRRAVSGTFQVMPRQKMTQQKIVQLRNQKETHPSSASRFISASLKRKVYQRDKSKCQNCGGNYALEIDHIHPFAKNGTNEPANLRLLCRSCNQYMAMKEFGDVKIREFYKR